MSNFQELAINFAYFYYNLKPVEVELKQQMPIFDKFYIEGETIKLPMWYARMVKPRKVCTIKEFEAFDRVFNKCIGDQNWNKTALVKIPRDFYFLAIDYINSLKNGKHLERKEKLVEFKEIRRKIIIRMIDLEQDELHHSTKNMSFEEVLFYYSILKVKKQSYKQLDSLMLEDEDED